MRRRLPLAPEDEVSVPRRGSVDKATAALQELPPVETAVPMLDTVRVSAVLTAGVKKLDEAELLDHVAQGPGGTPTSAHTRANRG